MALSPFSPRRFPGRCVGLAPPTAVPGKPFVAPRTPSRLSPSPRGDDPKNTGKQLGGHKKGRTIDLFLPGRRLLFQTFFLLVFPPPPPALRWPTIFPRATGLAPKNPPPRNTDKLCLPCPSSQPPNSRRNAEGPARRTPSPEPRRCFRQLLPWWSDWGKRRDWRAKVKTRPYSLIQPEKMPSPPRGPPGPLRKNKCKMMPRSSICWVGHRKKPALGKDYPRGSRALL